MFAQPTEKSVAIALAASREAVGRSVNRHGELKALPIRGRFGRLTVESTAPCGPDGSERVTCRCACGRLAVRSVTELRAGDAIACARCQRAEIERLEQVQPSVLITPPQPVNNAAALAWLAQLRRNDTALWRLLAELDRAVYRYLEERWGDRTARIDSQRREAHAAALRRLRFLTADDIALRVGAGVEVDRALVHQWVCRGRRVILRALDHWERRTRSANVRQQIAHLRSLMVAGRCDAGRPRPWARNAKRSRA